MPDPADPDMSKDILHRVRGAGEETVGKMAKDVLSSPLVTGAAKRAMEVRERATQAQEVAMGAFNVPSAADIERLTRRVRNVSQRLESIEDAVERLDDRLSDLGDDTRLRDIAAQLDRIEQRLAGGETA
ncbi:MAG: hypothetical protein M0P31_14525 [Solirubrobacteraceae bacterium]|nr:hypothetical protein [Solirubrobacteraceae bacterium]